MTTAADLKNRKVIRGSVTRLLGKLDGEGKLVCHGTKLKSEEEAELQGYIGTLKLKLIDLNRLDKEIICELEDEIEIENESIKADEYALNLNITISKLEKNITESKENRQKDNLTIHQLNVTSKDTFRPSSNNISHFKLPKLQLMQFAGDKLYWNQFWDSFTCSIHNNQTLSSVNKFGYLLASLTESARKCIAGLSVTEENYVQAVETLRKRYGDSSAIKNEHMRRLQELKCSNCMVDTLRTFYDDIKQNVFGLQNIGIRENSYEVMLVPLYLQRIPEVLRIKILEAAQSKLQQVNTLHIFLELLDCNIQLLELVNISTIHESGSNSMVSNNSHSKVKSSFSTYSSPNPIKSKVCTKCSGIHYIQDCPSFLSAKPSERFSIAQKNNLCYNCLIFGHRTASCRRGNQCSQCNSKHHPLLHNPENVFKRKEFIELQKCVPSDSATTSSVMLASESEEFNVLGNLQPKVSMLVIPVTIRCNNGSFVTNALLDPASDICMMSQTIKQRLYASETKKLNIKTVNGTQ